VPRVVSSAVPALRAGSVRFERIEQVASPAVLDLDKARADLTRWRGTVVGIIVQLVALALAIGCAVAVMRAARTAGAAAANEPAAARSRRAQG
jgi:hypothetical protein